MEWLDIFIEDCKYYDPKKIEIKTILKYAKLKGKTILDIGAGIGRLSFPLSKYAKEVIALDKDKRLLLYFKKHKKKNVKFVNKKAENYLKKKKKFDIILLAWPLFNFNFIKFVKNVMHKDSLFVFITCDNNSDYETIVKRLGVGKIADFNEKRKKRYIKLLTKNFKILIKKKINTEYVYPNEKIAFKVIKNSMKTWFNIKFNRKAEQRLKEIIYKRKKGTKIEFGEKIWFYLLKK